MAAAEACEGCRAFAPRSAGSELLGELFALSKCFGLSAYSTVTAKGDAEGDAEAALLCDFARRGVVPWRAEPGDAAVVLRVLDDVVGFLTCSGGGSFRRCHSMMQRMRRDPRSALASCQTWSHAAVGLTVLGRVDRLRAVVLVYNGVEGVQRHALRPLHATIAVVARLEGLLERAAPGQEFALGRRLEHARDRGRLRLYLDAQLIRMLLNHHVVEQQRAALLPVHLATIALEPVQGCLSQHKISFGPLPGPG